MGYNISAYLEKKGDDGKTWTLVSPTPISSNLKYVFTDANEMRKLNWDDLSEGMKEKFKKDESGEVYATFYTATIQEIEDDINRRTRAAYTKLNMVVRALGCTPIYSDDGEERDVGGTDGNLTIQINKDLIEDIQMGYDTMRSIGQCELFDMIATEKAKWDETCRVIFVTL